MHQCKFLGKFLIFHFRSNLKSTKERLESFCCDCCNLTTVDAILRLRIVWLRWIKHHTGWRGWMFEAHQVVTYCIFSIPWGFFREIWQVYTLTLHPLSYGEFWIRPCYCIIVTGLNYWFQDYSDGKLTYILWPFFPKEMHGKENWWSRWGGIHLLRPHINLAMTGAHYSTSAALGSIHESTVSSSLVDLGRKGWNFVNFMRFFLGGGVLAKLHPPLPPPGLKTPTHRL